MNDYEARKAQQEEQWRLYLQRSGQEVPGFHIRTVIDDTIGKLFALRQAMKTDIPDGLAALVDDIEALTEQAIDLAYDPDTPDIDGSDDHYNSPLPADPQGYGRKLKASGSTCIGWCSCGNPTL